MRVVLDLRYLCFCDFWLGYVVDFFALVLGYW